MVTRRIVGSRITLFAANLYLIYGLFLTDVGGFINIIIYSTVFTKKKFVVCLKFWDYYVKLFYKF